MIILQLRPGFWFNVDEIISAHDEADKYTKAPVLVVTSKHAQMSYKFVGEEREKLLAFFAKNALVY